AHSASLFFQRDQLDAGGAGRRAGLQRGGIPDPGQCVAGLGQPGLGYLMAADHRSIVGQAVHVLTGYEARPAGMQLAFWVVTFAVLVAGMRVMAWRMAAHRTRVRSASKVSTGAAAPRVV